MTLQDELALELCDRQNQQAFADENDNSLSKPAPARFTCGQCDYLFRNGELWLCRKRKRVEDGLTVCEVRSPSDLACPGISVTCPF
jgi:hypothetical protein